MTKFRISYYFYCCLNYRSTIRRINYIHVMLPLFLAYRMERTVQNGSLLESHNEFDLEQSNDLLLANCIKIENSNVDETTEQGT